MLHFTIIDLSASIWDVIYNRHMLVPSFCDILPQLIYHLVSQHDIKPEKKVTQHGIHAGKHADPKLNEIFEK